MEHPVVIGVGQRVVPGVGPGILHAGGQGGLDGLHLGGHFGVFLGQAAALEVHRQQQDDEHRQPDGGGRGVLDDDGPQQQDGQQHHVARVDVVHEQQHQRNDRAAKQRTALEHRRAAFVLIPDKADHRDEHNDQKRHTAAADVGRLTVECGQNIVPPGRVQQGRGACALIAGRRHGMELQ